MSRGWWIRSLAVLCGLATSAGARTLLDFGAGAEGFASVDGDGTVSHVANLGEGALRMTNPPAWRWRAKRTFTKTGGEDPRFHSFANELAAAGVNGGTLEFDLILRRNQAVSGKTGSFWGVQYNLAINQSPPSGNGWVQQTFLQLPASAYPPADNVTTYPVSVPLHPWSDGTGGLRIAPGSSWFELQFGSNFGGATGIEWHIDNLRVISDPPDPLEPGTIHLEAEDGALNGVSVSTAVPGYSGTGYVTGFSAADDHVAWSFPAAAGVYRLSVRFRTPHGNKGFNGTLNGEGFSGMFPASNSFASYDAGLIELAAGTNQLQIGGGWNWYEIDAVTMTPESPTPPLPVPGIPCNPLATPAARALLGTIAANYGRHTYSGQHGIAETSHILQVSGKLPAMIEGDLMNYSPSRVERQGIPADYTESILAKHDDGHILKLAWHWNAPTHLIDSTEYPWWRGFYTAGTTFDVAAALADPASTEYQLILRDIDAIAVQLQKAAAADIPILWRPLHESEGGWFWWGAKGPEPFKELWRLLHHRLTTHHGLHNLIWVLTSEHPAWYPGDDVVDVIGVDAYPSNRSDALSSRWEPLLKRFDGNKPIALTEFGGVPDVERMHRLGVFFAWFCSWTGPYGPTTEPAAKVARIYQSDEVLTLDELEVTLSHYQAWQLARFGTDADDPAIAGDAANPDHDGLANLLEYALGTDPNKPNPSPVTWEITGEPPALVITIPRDPAATDVTLEVEATDTLADPSSWSTDGVEILTNTPDLLIVRDAQPGPRRFFRIRATRNTPNRPEAH